MAALGVISDICRALGRDVLPMCDDIINSIINIVVCIFCLFCIPRLLKVDSYQRKWTVCTFYLKPLQHRIAK